MTGLAALAVEGGEYAVGCSGGPDSVALLLLARETPGVGVVVVHLNHEARGEESDGDERFVVELANRLGVACVVGRLGEVVAGMERRGWRRPGNRSAVYRAARLELFRRVCGERKLKGVMLAHHADDQAETCMLRLLRGSGVMGLGGMRERAEVGGVVLYRPLLGVRREELRRYLAERGEGFRVDASNESGAYLRNRVRKVMGRWPGVGAECSRVAGAMGEVGEWVRGAAPVLAEEFEVGVLAGLPEVLGREAGRRWLVARGVPAGEAAERGVVGRLLRMVGDMASPGVVEFPGGVRVRRKQGRMKAEG